MPESYVQMSQKSKVHLHVGYHYSLRSKDPAPLSVCYWFGDMQPWLLLQNCRMPQLQEASQCKVCHGKVKWEITYSLSSWCILSQHTQRHQNLLQWRPRLMASASQWKSSQAVPCLSSATKCITSCGNPIKHSCNQHRTYTDVPSQF